MTALLNRIGVCGAGAMGSGIAEIAAQRGADVLVFDVNADALTASEHRIGKSLDQLVSKGKLTVDQAAAARSRLAWTADLAQMAGRELVIEAVIEDASIKGALFTQLEAVLGDETIIATNTSSLPVARLARALARPGRFCGMHFFNPATVMKLVEVVSGPATDPGVAAAVLATATSWGKVAVAVADVPGFIVNRVARPFYAEAFCALGEGAAQPQAIDALFRAVGFRMGPLELTDLIGQDVNFAVARSVYDSYFGQTRFVPQLRQAALVDAGWLGRKTGRGVYDHAAGSLPQVACEAAGTVTDETASVAARLAGLVPGELIACGDVKVGLTLGHTANHEAASHGCPVALFDWLVGEGEGTLGFAASNDAAAEAPRAIATSLGRTCVRMADRPGLIVCRTLAQIANAAADAVFERVADEGAIDAAMQFGLNHPFGPFTFADRFGRERLAALLAAIAAATGQPLYAPSQYWSQRG